MTGAWLLCQKWRGAITISSMRLFRTRDELEAHLRTRPVKCWEFWHVYLVPEGDGGEAEHVSPTLAREIGLRPPRVGGSHA